jgi:hypothetical protein
VDQAIAEAVVDAGERAFQRRVPGAADDLARVQHRVVDRLDDFRRQEREAHLSRR